MAAVPLPRIDDLPRQNATHIKNKWGEVVRQVQRTGSLAITSHSNVQLVLLDAATYQKVTEQLSASEARERSALEALERRFEDRLAALDAPDAADKIDALFKARGRLVRRPRSGTGH